MVGFSETIEKKFTYQPPIKSAAGDRTSFVQLTGKTVLLHSWRGKGVVLSYSTTAGKEFYPPGGERSSFAQLERERTSFAQLAGKG